MPRGVVDAPSLEAIKLRFDGASSSQVKCKLLLPIAVGLELDDIKGLLVHNYDECLSMGPLEHLSL